jgi:hypothetical protein
MVIVIDNSHFYLCKVDGIMDIMPNVKTMIKQGYIGISGR